MTSTVAKRTGSGRDVAAVKCTSLPWRVRPVGDGLVAHGKRALQDHLLGRHRPALVRTGVEERSTTAFKAGEALGDDPGRQELPPTISARSESRGAARR